jgi:hypothetical protein
VTVYSSIPFSLGGSPERADVESAIQTASLGNWRQAAVAARECALGRRWRRRHHGRFHYCFRGVVCCVGADFKAQGDGAVRVVLRVGL